MPRPPRAAVASVTRSMRWSPDEWATVERLTAARGLKSASDLLRALVAEAGKRGRPKGVAGKRRKVEP